MKRRASGLIVLIFIPHYSCLSHCPKDRTSLPESHAAKAKKAAHLLHPNPGGRAGKAIPQAKVSSLRRASGSGSGSQNDRCPGEDVVPEPTHQVEVSSRSPPTRGFKPPAELEAKNQYPCSSLVPIFLTLEVLTA